MSTPQRKRNWPKASGTFDQCQTPPYALTPLLRYVPRDWRVWESAAGEGLLARSLVDRGYSVYATDKADGSNRLTLLPDWHYDIEITNPPYSIKYHWLERAALDGKPFALLMPVEMMGSWSMLELVSQHGIHVMFLDSRVNFKMPYKGWDGAGAQFPVAWYCHKLPFLPHGMFSIGQIDREEKRAWHDQFKPEKTDALDTQQLALELESLTV